MGAKTRAGIGRSYRPARLHRLAESIPGLLKIKKFELLFPNETAPMFKKVEKHLFLGQSFGKMTKILFVFFVCFC
jgi:hypothetical protein